MTVTEAIHALGSWSINLAEDTPDAVLTQLGYFGHVAIVQGPVDVERTGDGLLAGARYVGVLRERPHPEGGRSVGGSGMVFWLGDEDGKGWVFETALDLSGKTLAQCLPLILPPTVTLGTVYSGATGTLPAGSTFQFLSPRKVLDTVTAAFGREYRVNGNATVDVGTQAQLYRATPIQTMVRGGDAGRDPDLSSIGGGFDTGEDVYDYTTRAVLLGQKTDGTTTTQFATGAANAPAVPYVDQRGNTVKLTRLISEADQPSGTVAQRAQLQLNRFNRITRSLKLTTSEFEVEGASRVGDMIYVYDLDTGILDPNVSVDFRGQLIHPDVIRLSGATWPVTEGHTVAFRTGAGVWIDLTPYVLWETGGYEVTVGDLPASLSKPGDDPIQVRLDGTRSDASTPNPPTGLTLLTDAVQSSKGNVTATVSASWTAPALNTDGTVVTDLDYYVVQYRWHGRAPLWDTRYTADTSIDLPGLAVGLVYDVQVAAVDTSSHRSAFTAVSSITAAPDTFAPNPPSDPVVTSYLGQLRIAWNGKDNLGGSMPPDFAVVEVHVSSTSGFTPDSSPGSATLVSQLSTAGAAYATAPYGATRYVKLVAVDNSQNRSSPSGQVSGATVQVADGDMASMSVGKLTAGTMSADVTISGRFTTALTGARVEHNSLGFQGFQADGVTKWLSLTATESLLTGTVKTALTGRRIEIGAGGATGDINFFSPDGKNAFVRAWTESGGVEAVQFGLLVPSTNSLWNRINYNSSVNGEYATYRTGSHEFVFDGGTDQRDANGNNPGIGAFMVFEVSNKAASITPPAGLRMSINHTSTRHIFPSGGTYSVEERDANGTGWYRLFLDQNRITFYPGSDAFGYTEMWIGGTPGFVYSPYFKFLTPPIGGLLYGATIGYAVNTNLTNSGLEVHNVNGATSGFEAIKASAFIVSSDARNKIAPVVATDDFLAAITGTKVKRYRRPNVAGDPGPEEVGLIAQEAPPQLVAFSASGEQMLDLYQMVAYLWGAAAQINDVLTALKKGTP